MKGAGAVTARRRPGRLAWAGAGSRADRLAPWLWAAATPIGLLVVGYAASRLGAGSAPAGVVLVALIAGAAVCIARAPDRAWIWALSVPPAVRGFWADVAPTVFPAGLATCDDVLSPPAAWRIAEALLVGGSVVAVAVALRVRPGSLGLRLPSAQVMVLSATLPLVVAPAALVAGPVLARPFFEPFTLELGLPLAIVPALLFAMANGTMEEVVYRGAMLSWGERMLGPRAALWLQGILFGLAHGAGRDFIASPLPAVASLTVAGVIAGLIARRTGSLLLPIAVHVACDIPLYYFQACRLA